ncbi:MAG: ABC transporter permease [Chloroflexi bacterium]|nr:ABC transporter permease [Chloroflexota bacterium]
MIGPRWRKILRDLWLNKTRTLLVVLSIAVGVFGVGTVTHTFTTVQDEMMANYPKARPASATIYADAFDDTLLETIRRMPGIAEVEARTSLTLRLRVGPDEWKSLGVYAVPNFNDIRINQVVPQGHYSPAPSFGAERGEWPPADHAIVLERSSLLLPGLLPPGVKVGDFLEVETTRGPRRMLRIAGLAHEETNFPATFMSQAYGYVTLDTQEWLTDSRKPDMLMIIVADKTLDKNGVTAIANRVKEKMESGGLTVYAVQVPEPGKHPLQDLFAGLLLLLNSLGFASLILSGFLVVNTISALLSQQVRQIGMMKAIGARARQIVLLYLVMILMFGVMALVLAVPLSVMTAGQLSQYLAGFINTDFPPFTIPTNVIALEIAIGLIVPLVAGLLPVLTGTRVTIRQAISDYGISQQTKPGWFDRLLMSVRALSRPMRLSLRNTFRRKGRLALTLLTLILGGTIFISVLSARDSMGQTLEDLLKYWKFDVLETFARPRRIEEIEQIVRDLPGVVRVEMWGFSSVRRLRADGSESDSVILFAPSQGTTMLEPTVMRGRWLLPDDENAIVVSNTFLQTEPDVNLGDEITLKISNREHKWRVVGVVNARFGAGGVAYVNRDYYAYAVGETGRAASLQLETEKHDPVFQAQVKKNLEERFKKAGIRVGFGMTSGDIRTSNEVFFNIIAALLLAMAVLMAMVGGLGLMGTMSLNVIERTREIGVMRAVGASNGAVRGVVLVEGMFIGILSGLLASALAYPIGKLIAEGVGVALFQQSLSYQFSIAGVLVWMILVGVLSVLASILPAHNASRLTVREILAYE